MNATQLEAIVLEAISRLRGGGGAEDDRIEFKRAWPASDKARQLAGAANRANGDDLIYIIGVDEKDGTVHPANAVDPANWWAGMEAMFDEVAPELVRHLNVQTSETESVVSLLFRTDRTPYVVKIANGGQSEREVPIRAGTRTRSAHRHELLRLLIPSVGVPELNPIAGELNLGPPGWLGAGANEVVELRLSAHLYFEHVGNHPIFLPIHRSGVKFKWGDVEAHGTVHYSIAKDTPKADYGLTLRPDGIQVTGPGASWIQSTLTLPRADFEELAAVDEWRVVVSFAVAGSDRPATALLVFRNRSRKPGTSQMDDGPAIDQCHWELRPNRS